jgi:hypothetical protein
MRWRAALSILALAAPGWTAPASSLLIVSVGEVTTGAFIQDAEVRLVQPRRSERTKWDGEARFRDLDRGRVHVQVRAIGYAPADIDVELSSDSMEVHFELERVSVALDTMHVREAAKVPVYLQEFDGRRRQNVGGKFLTDSVLQADGLNSVQYVLAARFPSLQIRGNGVVSLQQSGLMSGSACTVRVYQDGFLLSVPLDQIKAKELIGAEYYSRTFAPVQYRPPGNYCAVILLWSRR